MQVSDPWFDWLVWVLNLEFRVLSLVFRVSCFESRVSNDSSRLSYKSAHLRDKLKTVIEKLIQLLPSTIIIWSQILPRLHWRGGGINQPAMERTRMWVNSYVATLLIRLGGKYIRYHELHKPFWNGKWHVFVQIATGIASIFEWFKCQSVT